jgi:Transposase, Mutator family
MPSDRRISNEVIDELLAGASTEEEIAGPGGLLAELTKRLVERAMEVELTDHVGYERHQEPPGGAANQRNGRTPKTLICGHGPVGIDAPRDREAALRRRSSASANAAQVGQRDESQRLASRARRHGGLEDRDLGVADRRDSPLVRSLG